MVPSSISTDTLSTACTPPNERLTLVSCSSALTRSPARPPARRDDGESAPADDALRSEDDDQDQDDAIDHVAIGSKLAHDFWQRGEEDRANDRADHVRGPANHGERQDLDGAGDAVLGGVDEEIDMGLEGPGVAGDEGADDEGDHLVDRHVDAVAGGRQLINVPVYKMVAFIISALVAGYAGALETHINFFVDPTEYSVTRTIQILTFAVVGGTTNVIGPIVGAVFLTALPEIVRQFAAYRDVVNGVILILVIIFRPQGIVGRGGLAIIAPRWWTRWRTRERAAAAH